MVKQIIIILAILVIIIKPPFHEAAAKMWAPLLTAIGAASAAACPPQCAVKRTRTHGLPFAALLTLMFALMHRPTLPACRSVLTARMPSYLPSHVCSCCRLLVKIERHAKACNISLGPFASKAPGSMKKQPDQNCGVTVLLAAVIKKPAYRCATRCGPKPSLHSVGSLYSAA